MNIQYILVPAVLVAFCCGTVAQDEMACVPNKTMIYFGNGMNTDFQDAKLNLCGFQSKMAGIFPEATPISWGISYNQKEDWFTQLLEVARQENSDNFSSFFEWMGDLNAAPQWFRDWMISAAKTFSTYEYVNDEDLQKHVQRYRADILEGNRIILVAHSQGNFYANSAGLSLSSNSFRIVSVGTPANSVWGGGEYTTLTNDLVVNAVRTVVDASTLPGTTINSHSYEWLNHLWENSYLNGDVSGPRIISQIQTAFAQTPFPIAEGQPGIITVTLEWGSEPDVDLHVFEPNGTHVYYDNMNGMSGYLDVDDITSYGPEHYFVGCQTLETGVYTIGVNYFSGSAPEVAHVQVKAGSVVRTYEITLSTSLGSLGDDSPIELATVTVSRNNTTGKYSFEITSLTPNFSLAKQLVTKGAPKAYTADRRNSAVR
jgi:hypothetical protein